MNICPLVCSLQVQFCKSDPRSYEHFHGNYTILGVSFGFGAKKASNGVFCKAVLEMSVPVGEGIFGRVTKPHENPSFPPWSLFSSKKIKAESLGLPYRNVLGIHFGGGNPEPKWFWHLAILLRVMVFLNFAGFSLGTPEKIRAACLQNEIAPEKLLSRYEEQFEKR